MWQVEIPFKPVPAPRPKARRNKEQLKAQGKETSGQKRVSTYYSEEYREYLNLVADYLESNQLYNDEFFRLSKERNGVIMEVDFFYPIPKSHNKLYHIFKVSAPDIDNLLKSAMDAIFNRSGIKDSIVTGVVAFKYNVSVEPKTVVRLKDYEEYSKKISSDKPKKNADSSMEWSLTLPFRSEPTPRPKAKTTSKGLITYYSNKYYEYQKKISEYLFKEGHINDQLMKVVSAENGVIAEINYFHKVNKNTKKLSRLMRTEQPDIDNLVKGTLDGIFTKELGVKDSRVVGLIAFKYNTFEESKTEIRLRGI